MTDRKTVPTSRDAILAEFKLLAERAEASGDRFVAVRALKYAWHIERRCPTNPVPPSLDRMVALSGAFGPLVQRFAPESADELAAQIAGLRRCQLELALLESETATVH